MSKTTWKVFDYKSCAEVQGNGLVIEVAPDRAPRLRGQHDAGEVGAGDICAN